MNVLFFSEMFHPHGGGAELATYLFAKLLIERGFNVTVLTNQFNGEPRITKAQKMTIYRLPLFKGTGSVKYSILRRLDVLFSSFIRKMVNWADVVYVPRFWYSIIPLAKARKKPVVIHLHDYIPICPLSNFFNVHKLSTCDRYGLFCPQKCIYLYEKLNERSFSSILSSMLLNSTLGCLYSKLIGLSDAVICVSHAQRELLLKNYAFMPSEVCVIYNPLPEMPLDSFKTGNDFGYFGGSSYLKGFHLLCKAVALVEKVKSIRIHATKFYDVGSEYSFLIKLGFRIYGKLDSKKYLAIYNKIRAVIIPSVWSEPSPYVTLEALLAGKIVIASRVGGIPEQVDGCPGAFLFEPNDYRALARNILYVSDLSRDEVTGLGIRNRKFVTSRFDNKAIGDSFSALLEKFGDDLAVH